HTRHLVARRRPEMRPRGEITFAETLDDGDDAIEWTNETPGETPRGDPHEAREQKSECHRHPPGCFEAPVPDNRADQRHDGCKYRRADKRPVDLPAQPERAFGAPPPATPFAVVAIVAGRIIAAHGPPARRHSRHRARS